MVDHFPLFFELGNHSQLDAGFFFDEMFEVLEEVMIGVKLVAN
jgi:hypothetical protein